MESTDRGDGDIEKLKRSLSSSSLAYDTKDDPKVTKILEACKWQDLEALRIYAESEGGLISDEVRRLACSCHQGDI
jgi:hypothetical protein